MGGVREEGTCSANRAFRILWKILTWIFQGAGKSYKSKWLECTLSLETLCTAWGQGRGWESNKESLSRRMDECWWRARGSSEDTLSSPRYPKRKAQRDTFIHQTMAVHHHWTRRCSGATVAAIGQRDEMPALLELTF